MSAVTVRATLGADPFVSLAGDGTAHLQLQVRLDGCRTGVLASVRYSCAGAHHIARNDARRMRRGDAITLHAAAFDIDADGRLRLFGVDHFTPHPAPLATTT